MELVMAIALILLVDSLLFYITVIREKDWLSFICINIAAVLVMAMTALIGVL